MSLENAALGGKISNERLTLIIIQNGFDSNPYASNLRHGTLPVLLIYLISVTVKMQGIMEAAVTVASRGKQEATFPRFIYQPCLSCALYRKTENNPHTHSHHKDQLFQVHIEENHKISSVT